MNNKLKMAWLFPSTFYLHGERGNVLSFKQIAKDLNLDLDVDMIELHDPFKPSQYDLIYCPAGEIVHFPVVIGQLDEVKDELNDFVNSGKPLIVTGNSISLFGHKIVRQNGQEINGLDIIDIVSFEQPDVYGDDEYYIAHYNGKDLEVLGTQIRMSDIDLRTEKPFGELKYGYGNTGKDKKEGILKSNSIFINTLGPAFALNPWVAQEIIKIAARNKGLAPIEKELDFDWEKKSLELKKEYTFKKKTNLKNT